MTRLAQLAPGLCGTCSEGLVNFEKAVCTHLTDRLRERFDPGRIMPVTWYGRCTTSHDDAELYRSAPLFSCVIGVLQRDEMLFQKFHKSCCHELRQNPRMPTKSCMRGSFALRALPF